MVMTQLLIIKRLPCSRKQVTREQDTMTPFFAQVTSNLTWWSHHITDPWSHLFSAAYDL